MRFGGRDFIFDVPLQARGVRFLATPTDISGPGEPIAFRTFRNPGRHTTEQCKHNKNWNSGYGRKIRARLRAVQTGVEWRPNGKSLKMQSMESFYDSRCPSASRLCRCLSLI